MLGKQMRKIEYCLGNGYVISNTSKKNIVNTTGVLKYLKYLIEDGNRYRHPEKCLKCSITKNICIYVFSSALGLIQGNDKTSNKVDVNYIFTEDYQRIHLKLNNTLSYHRL